MIVFVHALVHALASKSTRLHISARVLFVRNEDRVHLFSHHHDRAAAHKPRSCWHTNTLPTIVCQRAHATFSDEFVGICAMTPKWPITARLERLASSDEAYLSPLPVSGAPVREFARQEI